MEWKFEQEVRVSKNELKEKEKALKEIVDSYLEVAEKRKIENRYSDVPVKLGRFLIKRGLIKEVGVWKDSWGFSYNSDSKKINIAEDEMSEESYKYYIFCLGKRQDGVNLFPVGDDELDQYRFLHEVNHAYQEYLMQEEVKSGNSDDWINKVLTRRIDSTFGVIFEYCYNKRKQFNKGLSTWGNVPDYNNLDVDSQNAIRAIEDSNELVTMFLWNPKYLDTFLEYVSLEIDGFDEQNLNQDGFVKISSQEKDALREIIIQYVDEMTLKIER